VKYFEILPECPAYELFVELFTSRQKWNEKEVKEISAEQYYLLQAEFSRKKGQAS